MPGCIDMKKLNNLYQRIRQLADDAKKILAKAICLFIKIIDFATVKLQSRGE